MENRAEKEIPLPPGHEHLYNTPHPSRGRGEGKGGSKIKFSGLRDRYTGFELHPFAR